MVQWLRLPTQNTGSQGSIPGQGTRSHVGFPGGSVVKNPPTMQEIQEMAGSIPGSGRSPGEGNGDQYSCLANPMDRGA